MSILNKKFPGQAESEFEESNSQVKRYSDRSKETISDNIKIATVMGGL